jgi:hypothetical protein
MGGTRTGIYRGLELLDLFAQIVEAESEVMLPDCRELYSTVSNASHYEGLRCAPVPAPGTGRNQDRGSAPARCARPETAHPRLRAFRASTSIGRYFATEEILNGSSIITRPITTNTAVTPGWPELRRRNAVADPHNQSLSLSHILGGNIATAYFRPQLPPELEFDSDKTSRSVKLKRRAAAVVLEYTE